MGPKRRSDADVERVVAMFVAAIDRLVPAAPANFYGDSAWNAVSQNMLRLEARLDGLETRLRSVEQKLTELVTTQAALERVANEAKADSRHQRHMLLIVLAALGAAAFAHLLRLL